MTHYQQIIAEMARQYDGMRDAIMVGPTPLAYRVHEAFSAGTENAVLAYASFEHLKHMARKFLAERKSADGDDGEAYAQTTFDLGVQFSGTLQDRYPIPRKGGEEPVYKLRSHLTADERKWNVRQLRKSGNARLEHADALEAEGLASVAAE